MKESDILVRAMCSKWSIGIQSKDKDGHQSVIQTAASVSPKGRVKWRATKIARHHVTRSK